MIRTRVNAPASCLVVTVARWKSEEFSGQCPARFPPVRADRNTTIKRHIEQRHEIIWLSRRPRASDSVQIKSAKVRKVEDGSSPLSLVFRRHDPALQCSRDQLRAVPNQSHPKTASHTLAVFDLPRAPCYHLSAVENSSRIRPNQTRSDQIKPENGQSERKAPGGMARQRSFPCLGLPSYTLRHSSLAPEYSGEGCCKDDSAGGVNAASLLHP